MTTTQFAVGSRIMVRHDLGIEAATIKSASRPAYGESRVYTVQFDDGTVSSWPEFRIQPIIDRSR